MMGRWGAYMPLATALALLVGPLAIAAIGWRGWWGRWRRCRPRWRWGSARPCRRTPFRPRPRHRCRRLPRLRMTLAAPGPWLVAVSFAMYSGQWLAVIGFLPSIYVQSGIAGSAAGVLTAAVRPPTWSATSARAGCCNAASLRLACCRSASPPWGGRDGHFAGGGDAGLAPALRYAAVLLFSRVGGLIPATLFALAVRWHPAKARCRRPRLGAAMVGVRPVRRAAARRRGGQHPRATGSGRGSPPAPVRSRDCAHGRLSRLPARRCASSPIGIMGDRRFLESHRRRAESHSLPGEFHERSRRRLPAAPVAARRCTSAARSPSERGPRGGPHVPADLRHRGGQHRSRVRLRALGRPDAVRRRRVRDVRPGFVALGPTRRPLGPARDDDRVLLRDGGILAAGLHGERAMATGRGAHLDRHVRVDLPPRGHSDAAAERGPARRDDRRQRLGGQPRHRSGGRADGLADAMVRLADGVRGPRRGLRGAGSSSCAWCLRRQNRLPGARAAPRCGCRARRSRARWP